MSSVEKQLIQTLTHYILSDMKANYVSHLVTLTGFGDTDDSPATEAFLECSKLMFDGMVRTQGLIDAYEMGEESVSPAATKEAKAKVYADILHLVKESGLNGSDTALQTQKSGGEE